VNGAAALVERGIRAFMRGARDEAERCWREALAADPADARAREYLDTLARAVEAEPPPPPPARAGAAEPAPSGSAWDELSPGGVAIALPAEGGLDLGALLSDGAPAPAPPPEPAPAPPPAPEAAPPALAEWMQSARERFALGDFSGSLELIERVLHVAPRHPEALAYLDENEATLLAMYESRIGALDGVPRVRLRSEEVLWLNLDHRAGFLLAQIDGTVTWDDLFALSGLPRLETARILARLVDEGVVGA
jgi:hypothetical protein